MTRAHQTRLPLRPLMVAARTTELAALARHLDVPRRRIMEWHANGVPFYRADDLAARLGYHPAELWAEWLTMPDYHRGTEPGTHGPPAPYVHPSTINPSDPFTTDQEATA